MTSVKRSQPENQFPVRIGFGRPRQDTEFFLKTWTIKTGATEIHTIYRVRLSLVNIYKG